MTNFEYVQSISGDINKMADFINLISIDSCICCVYSFKACKNKNCLGGITKWLEGEHIVKENEK